MGTKNEVNTGDDGLKRGEFSDFALVLKDGQDLKCQSQVGRGFTSVPCDAERGL